MTTKITLSDSAAKAVVKAGTIQTTKAVQKVSRIQDSPSVVSDDITLALVAVRGWKNGINYWVQDSNNVYYTDGARFVNETTLERGSADVTVYMTSAPAAEAFMNTLYSSWYNRWAVLRNNRWELLDFQWTDEGAVSYAGSTFISITPSGSGYSIENKGVCEIYTANGGASGPIAGQKLYFSANFKSQPTTVVDVVGGTEIELKTHNKEVVTGITASGNTISFTKKTIKVLGDAQ